MTNLRTYGQPPFRIAVVHGGPGGPGSMAPVARELSAQWGILEPLQTAPTVEGQIEELATVLAGSAQLPADLVGHSWGAWLAYLVAAHHPALVHKLVLVGSGGFEAQYAQGLMEARLQRLSQTERAELESLRQRLSGPETEDRNATFARLGHLISQADAYDPLPEDPNSLEVQASIYESVWPQAAEMRRNGELLGAARQIECPVVAIHGDHDPHPAEGVEKPLSGLLTEFTFHLLKRCGHRPWYERQAREEFYRILRQELTSVRNETG